MHVPVLAQEIITWLLPAREPSAGGPSAGEPSEDGPVEGVFIDGTCGGGGHARLILERLGPTARLLALDRDAAALERTASVLADPRLEFVHANYCDLVEVLRERSIERIHGIVLDLGLSSDQLADAARGFSFDSAGELDMRFDRSVGEPAWQLLQRLRTDQLADLIYQYGEERHSRRIARAIHEARVPGQIWTASGLAEIVRRCLPRAGYDRIDPATRTFQALRIAVNRELESLEKVLRDLPDVLAPGGRAAIISFHSLEDRIVKWAFRNDDRWEILTKKPVTAGEAELQQNPRSRSAKLRVAARRE